MKKRLYNKANREKINLAQREKSAIRGGLPKSRRRGHLAGNWSGGEMMYCAVPGCHRVAGWKRPKAIKINKTGFRCPAHQHVCLPKIKEQDYDYQTPQELQLSMA